MEGEISNLSRPSSGHLYFTLKDENAQVRCAFFRRHQGLLFNITNGLQILVRAKVSLYENRGDYQLIIDHLEPAGDGRLRLAFEQLKQKLAAEGLFDPRYKKALPKLPQHIGVITSSSGAAIHDILTVLKRRFPCIPVTVLPVNVQGKEAAAQIATAIQQANELKLFDVLIVGRGGGSLEDLWPFNEERVARAIFASKIPIVSAVGHEIDFTIADFVADVRAPTPSAAAELLSPDCQEWFAHLNQQEQRLIRQMQVLLFNKQQKLEHLVTGLKHPGRRLQEQTQRLDELEFRLQKNIAHILRQQHSRFQTVQATLNVLSPLATLDRGYAILYQANHHILRDVTETKPGDLVTAKLHKGQLICTVKAMQHEN